MQRRQNAHCSKDAENNKEELGYLRQFE